MVRYIGVTLLCMVVIAGNGVCALSNGEVRKIRSINETGKEYFISKDYDKAVREFSQALAYDPDNQVLKSNLAHAYIGASIKQKDKGNVRKAISLLEKSLSLDESIADTHVILAACYMELGDHTSAKGELKIARIYKPDHPSITTMLGEIYFQEGDMENAITCWTKSQENQPFNETLTNKIDLARREWNLIKTFERTSVHPFTLIYEKEHEKLVRQAHPICMDAYMEVGKVFMHYPISGVIIIFYTPDQFREITHAPDTVAGLYDGKIRVKMTDKLRDPEEMKKLIYHEYAHVLIKILTNDECPFWLNEGLAQAISGPVANIDLTMLANLELENDLFHIKNMNRFGGVTHVIDHDLDSTLAVKIAYTKSLITTNYILRQYGMDACLRLLDKIRSRSPIDQAVQTVLGISIDELDAQSMDLIARTKDKIIKVLHEQRDNSGEPQS